MLPKAVAKVAAGYGVAAGTQRLVFPRFGLPARVSGALGTRAILAPVSVLRRSALRRSALRRVSGTIRVRRSAYR